MGSIERECVEDDEKNVLGLSSSHDGLWLVISGWFVDGMVDGGWWWI